MGSIQIEEITHSLGPLIVGGGPVGMLSALRLAQLGVPCTLCEMNTETTRWPKMDHNSCHTMEILRIMGLAEEYRQQPGAVPQHRDWDTIFFNTCGPKKKVVTRWVCLSGDCRGKKDLGLRLFLSKTSDLIKSLFSTLSYADILY